MESTPDYRSELLDAERAAAAPYTEYPALGGWYPWATGLLAAALTANATLLDAHPRLHTVALVVIVAAEVGFVWWYRTKRGTSPSMRGMPREIAREMRLFTVGCVVVIGGVAAVVALFGDWAGIVVAFVLAAAAVRRYERRYAAAAAATRARLR
ncbi:MAG: hypothetical protein WB441_12955 [Nocardioidaceae bacterium]